MYCTDERGSELPNRSAPRRGRVVRPSEHVPEPPGPRPTREGDEDERPPAPLRGGAHHLSTDVQIRPPQRRVRHVGEAEDPCVVRPGAVARARPDARRAAALPAIRAGHLGPPPHLGGVPRAGQVDPAGRAGQDEGGGSGAVVRARDAAAGRCAGVLHRAAGPVIRASDDFLP